MIKRVTAIFAFAALGALFGCTSPQERTQKFLMEASQGGMLEVQLGRLATERAASPAVKQFGQRMVDDHTRSSNELKELAAKKGIALPQELSSEQKSMVSDLSKLSGSEFDEEYIEGMVEDHEKDVEHFGEQAKTGTDNEVKAFAAKTLPTLEQHLRMAREIAEKVGS